VFPRDDEGRPFWWDYQLKGYFKDVAGQLRRVKGSLAADITAYKKIIDSNLNIGQRRVVINAENAVAEHPLALSEPLVLSEVVFGNCSRPLRVVDKNGERVCIADSETVAAGSYCEYEIWYSDLKAVKKTAKEKEEKSKGKKAKIETSAQKPKLTMKNFIEEMLDWGAVRGTGQWRSSGKGRFTWEEIERLSDMTQSAVNTVK
jgi:hypothetical protein